MQPNGDTPKAIAEHPALAGIELPRTGSPSRAGMLVTKTLLLAGEGWGGGNGFYAYDKKSGEILSRIALPATQTGLPITYLLDGRQYVVLSVGDSETPASLVALAVPRD
jgi:quinoprotein glucose dehydrogenase